MSEYYGNKEGKLERGERENQKLSEDDGAEEMERE